MGLHAMTAVFLLSYLCIPEEAMGTISSSKSRYLERRHQVGRLPLTDDLFIQTGSGGIGKRRQEQFDDYGHMRFGKRGEASEDYGHMRFVCCPLGIYLHVWAFVRLTSKLDWMADPHWQKTFFYLGAERRKWLIMLVAGTTAVYASRTSVPLLIPVIAKERNWSRTDSGAVLSSFFWGYTLTQVVGGYLADRMGGQKVILIAAVGWSVVTVAMPIIIRLATEDLEFLLVISARIAHGAFQGAHFPGMSSLASRRLSDKDRAAFFSLATSGSAFGTLLTGLVGSFILEHSNWQSVFYVIGALCCSWTLLFYYMCNISDGDFTLEENAKVPWITLFRKPAFWSCVFAHACQNNCFFTLLSWMPTYFHDVFPEAKGWIVNMVPWLFTVPCTLLGKWISEWLLSRGFSVTATRKSVEAICLMSQSIGLLALDQINSLGGALICIVLTIGATGFHNSAVVVNPGDLAPRHSGSVFGLMNTVGSIPGFLGVYAAGEILQKTHSWAVVFNVTAAVNILGCLLYLRYASGLPIVQ